MLEPGLDASRRLERRGVEHEVGRGVETQEHVPARQAREVDVGEGHRVPGQRLDAARPVGQVDELGAQEVLAVLGLLEGRLLERDRADVPAALMVSGGLARLHLEHEQTMLGVGDDRVRLPVARGAVDAHGPGPPDVGVEAVVARGQGGPQARLDVALGVLSAGHGARMSLDAESTYPSGVRCRLGQMRRSHPQQR